LRSVLIFSTHLLYDICAQINVNNIGQFADIVHAFGQSGITATHHQNSFSWLDILMNKAAEILVLSIPLEGLVTSEFKKLFPVVFVGKFLATAWHQV